MIIQNKIKINFSNYEKILSLIPSSFAEFKELFHELFEEANTNINYKFKYNLNNNDKYISEKDFQKAMDDLNKMNNPIIYVVKDKDEDFNLFEKLKNNNNDSNIFDNKSSVVSEYLNNSNNIINNNSNNSEEKEDSINDSINIKFENLKKNLAQLDEKLKEEIERNDSLKEQIGKLININNQNKKELNQNNRKLSFQNLSLVNEVKELKQKISELINRNDELDKKNIDLNGKILELNNDKKIYCLKMKI